MDINSLEIKNIINYDINNISHNANPLRVTKKELRIGGNIYYIRCALNPDDDIIIPLYSFINDLIGYIKEIDGILVLSVLLIRYGDLLEIKIILILK